MNMKLATLALVGVLALGGTMSAFAASSNPTPTTALASTGVVNVANPNQQGIEKDQTKEDGKENDEQALTVSNTKTSITEEQAKQTALASVKDGVFKAIELEDEDGVIVYGVEVQVASNSYDIKVDANTGAIVKTDQGNDQEEKGKIEKDSKDADNDNIQHENDNEDPAGYED